MEFDPEAKYFIHFTILIENSADIIANINKY